MMIFMAGRKVYNMNKLTCFKAYDVRCKLGEGLNKDIAYKIGRAFAQHLDAKTIALGADIRPTSESLKMALAEGIMDAGADVIDLGITGTEEVYFAAMDLDIDGGIEITASHNPIDYNGMKFIGKNATPIANDETGLLGIKSLAESEVFKAKITKGKLTTFDNKQAFVDHLLTYIQLDKLKPLKLVVNAGNGVAGSIIDLIEQRFKAQNIKIEFIKIHHQADGSFPNGIPNPLLIENRDVTAKAVIQHQADLGIAWDGDFDRCFFFDETGAFIEGYYIVGLLAEAFLKKYLGQTIIHDPRLMWNTQDIVQNHGGKTILSNTGHSFIKAKMRKENAIYGGEMSAHHYFRDFSYCDSGMIPWLLIIELLSTENKPLSELVNKRISLFPCSGEINFKVEDAKSILKKIKIHYQHDLSLVSIDEQDGLTMNFDQWRFNIRASNTEPLLRLNVETRADEALLEGKVNELKKLIQDQ